MQVLKIVTTDLQRLKIPHVVFGGAILGWARNEQFVPYDQDTDIWMDGKFIGTPQFNQLLKNWTSLYGFYTEYRDGKGKLWGLYSPLNAWLTLLTGHASTHVKSRILPPVL